MRQWISNSPLLFDFDEDFGLIKSNGLAKSESKILRLLPNIFQSKIKFKNRTKSLLQNKIKTQLQKSFQEVLAEYFVVSRSSSNTLEKFRIMMIHREKGLG